MLGGASCNTLTQTRSEVVANQAAAPDAASLVLASMLVGSYSTHAQAIADPAFHDLNLEIVRCWTDRADGPWLYLEQSSTSTIDKPYKQRVYKLVNNLDGTVTVLAFELPGDPLPHALAWMAAQPLNDLTPELLVAQDGCALSITLAQDGLSATGGTEGTHCPSPHAGVSYATLELITSASTLQLWERGFDETRAQVSGSRVGPCAFVKLAQSPPAVTPANATEQK